MADTKMLSETFFELVELAVKFNVEIDEQLSNRCTEYAALLLEENETTNLTRLTEPRACMIGMFLDSLLFLKHFKRTRNTQILDIGTGGGFPGMVLALSSPKLMVTAIDSRHRKTDFINKAAATMNVPNINAIHTRAQELEAEKFDLVVARAVGSLEKTLKLALPHVKPKGRMIVACSQKAFDAKVGKKLKLNLKSFPYTLPGYTNSFTHVVANKR